MNIAFIALNYSVLHICIFNEQQTTNFWNREKPSELLQSESNLFNVNSNSNEPLMVVNAWDPQSFIGNGLSTDGTIDGMCVAGIKNGNQLINSSYYHNYFLSPSVLEPSHWNIDLIGDISGYRNNNMKSIKNASCSNGSTSINCSVSSVNKIKSNQNINLKIAYVLLYEISFFHIIIEVLYILML